MLFRWMSRALVLVLLSMLLLGLSNRPPPARAQAGVTVHYRAGWNLVGAPAGTRFNGVVGDLLTLLADGSGYEGIPATSVLEGGRGYWAYFGADTDVPLAAVNATGFEVDAPAGIWVIAGNPAAGPARVTGADLVYRFDPISGYAAGGLLPAGRGALVYSATGAHVTIEPAPDTIRGIASTSGSPPATSAVASTIASAAPAQTGGAAIQVVASGFGQTKAGSSVVAGLLLRNTSAGAVDLTPIAITIFDASGIVIAAGETTLHYLGPGQTTGMAARLKVDGATAVAARIDARASDGRPAGDPPPGKLSFSQISLSTTRSGLEASALLSSSFAFDLTEVHVSALTFDASGAIIGGGGVIKRVVPAGGSTGVVAVLEASGTPARVEFYAQLP